MTPQRWKYHPNTETAPCAACGPESPAVDWPGYMARRIKDEDGMLTTWDVRRNEDCDHEQQFPANFLLLGSDEPGGEVLPEVSLHPNASVTWRS